MKNDTPRPNFEYPDTLRVVSINCWGLKYLSKHRRERLREIGARIASLTPRPDIVGLQECWTQEDYHSILAQTQHFLPFAKFYFSGIFGGGLAILSRWPIHESSMYRYPLNGRPTAFFRGDWFVGKGVACAKIKIGPGRNDFAEVFCTHLHAPYEKEPHDSYICHRTAQAWDIAKLMRGAAERGHLVIGLGDFNMTPLSLAHQLIEGQAPVRDVWRLVHPDSSLGAAFDSAESARGQPMPDAQFNLVKNGTTCDSAYNTWRWDKARQQRLDAGETLHVKANTADPHAKRLDYIFVGTSSSGGAGKTWRVDAVNVGLTERHPTLLCSLSDHFSVEASLSCQNTLDNGELMDSNDPRSSMVGDIKVSEIPASSVPMSSEVFDEILTMINKYRAREIRQRRLRLGHFGISLFASFGCLIAVWWSPRNGIAFLLVLISSLGLSAGVIDGLIGGLFIGSELRALKEFEWEIRNARKQANAD